MILILPFEVTFSSQIHFQTASGEWLSESLDLHSRDMMHEFMQNLSKFGETSEISNFLRIHLIERLPTKLLFLLQSA